METPFNILTLVSDLEEKMAKNNIKVLLSKLGLDVHNRGVLTVAKNLRDSGMDVIYIGNSTIEQMLETALQEDAEIIGVSSLGGAHMQLGKELIDKARDKDIFKNRVFIIGGAIPDNDIGKLKKMGFDLIFTSGATKDEIVSEIEKKFKQKTC